MCITGVLRDGITFLRVVFVVMSVGSVARVLPAKN